MYKKRINGNFITEKIINKTILDKFKSKQARLRRGSVNWKIYQKKIARLKHRDKRMENIETEAMSEQIMTKNFLKLMKDINSLIQEALQDPKQYKYKEIHTQLIIVKLLKTNE